MSLPLKGKVAVVTGASRGIGKGIALELGASGATVYLTGRTVDPGPLPGTITETAAEINALGGTGIAVRCDHHADDQVAELFARVEAEQGCLDILVNNVFSSPDLAQWLHRPFWELPLQAWDQVLGIGLRSHYVAGVYAAPLLFKTDRPSPLIVNISSSGATSYGHNVVYGVGKAALDKMTADMAVELRPHGIAVRSVWPGLVFTELLAGQATTTDDGRTVIAIPGEGTFDVAHAESPRFVGRGIAALAGDPEVFAHSGTTVTTAELASRYGFTDVDGTGPGTSLRSGSR
ncbi:SDR family NAD(P)-dependent oxidoreductase [Nocardia cyriacigeorgica]|uniref:SDR family NAD(P)-dependent oxidoreductase n=1 Tax=Nocardia cyriacigeorgica TaxID=135487 RepID=A0A6P1D5H3_9NOCA|nr:SDR family NAD(P)-dependent oxidoreductase [Nocardia cyriacigeorgica]NEW39595.1 SDR family NAD(P)-dependent oxidoreductase [Nocardia cyriacigeorgica]NEW44654.1 SDR family NAD(P)-dependent oxidoreductase [Nocardia cyriacigeorgica]NEW57270.1 SDR family NAD(P)-dependent oxidoreductase [Nocardia cyriacigeorgica]